MDKKNITVASYLGIDIGGTWIKGSMLEASEKAPLNWKNRSPLNPIVKVKSPLDEATTIDQLSEALKQLIQALNINNKALSGIGISTAGIVDYAGKHIVKAAGHLTVLKSNGWVKNLEENYGCPVILINDADATTIGMAELNLLKGNKTIGIMPIGTGLGFTVWRNGRRWRPGKTLNLLGSIRKHQKFQKIKKLN